MATFSSNFSEFCRFIVWEACVSKTFCHHILKENQEWVEIAAFDF